MIHFTDVLKTTKNNVFLTLRRTHQLFALFTVVRLAAVLTQVLSLWRG